MLAIVTQDPANRGGVLRLVRYAYSRAAALGMEPTVVHYAATRFHPELSASLYNLLRGEFHHRPAAEMYDYDGMHALAIGSYFPELEPMRFRGSSVWQQTLEEFDRYLLVTGSAQTGLPLVMSGKRYSSWISATIESDRSERLRRSRGIAAKLEQFMLPATREAERKVLATSTENVAVSNQTAAELELAGFRTNTVLSFPIDTSFWKSTKIRARLRRIVFVGRADDPRKNFTLFLEAFKLIRKAVPDIVAVVVSKQAPEGCKLPDGMTFVSDVTDFELRDIYETSSLFCITSEQEGLGIAAMEAMACGLPVISTRCGGPQTFIQDGVNGMLVDSTKHAFAEAAIELLANPSRLEELATLASTTIQNQFSESVLNPIWDRFLRNLPT